MEVVACHLYYFIELPMCTNINSLASNKIHTKIDGLVRTLQHDGVFYFFYILTFKVKFKLVST